MTDTALLLDTAFGHGKAKLIARGIDCSHRQARRMLERRSIPTKLKGAVLRLARTQLENKLANLEAAIDALRLIELEEGASSSFDRVEYAVSEDVAQGDLLADRPAELTVMEACNGN